jgi:hypothetical protein
MTNIIRIALAMVLIVGAGLVHGSWTSRWRPAPALQEQAKKLESLPMVLGDWTAISRELPARELAMTGAAGYINRLYTNSSKGLSISVLLLSGLPGDISTHTPEVCYPGAGYYLATPDAFALTYGSPEQKAELRTAVAIRGGANPSVLRIFWVWKGSKGWSAPEQPRWTFASESVLSKLYIVRQTEGVAIDPKNDPSNEFIKVLLPELDRAVFKAGNQISGASASATVAPSG